MTSSVERWEQMLVVFIDYTRYLNQIGTQLKKQTSIMPNSLIMNIQDGGGHHIEFRKLTITPDWMTIFPPNLVHSRLYGDDRMNRNRNRKLICVTSSGFQPTCIQPRCRRIRIIMSNGEYGIITQQSVFVAS